MGNTTNHNIYFLSNGDPQSQITESATQAGTIETALDSVSGDIESVNNFGVQYFANASARDLALVSPSVGWLTQLDSELFMRRWDGAEWVPFGSSGINPSGGAVSGTGVTQPQPGLIVASGASFVTIDGCFWDSGSGFDGYTLDYQLSISTPTQLQFQFRAGGATVSAAQYDRQTLQVVSGSSASGQSPAQTSWTGWGANAPLWSGTLRLQNVATASPSTGTMISMFTANPMTASNGGSTNFLLHQASTAFDGFRIAPTSGTISGTIRVVKEL